MLSNDILTKIREGVVVVVDGALVFFKEDKLFLFR